MIHQCATDLHRNLCNLRRNPRDLREPHPVGVQAATIKLCVTASLRAVWTSTSAPKGCCSSVCCSLWIADFLVCTLLSLSPPPDTRKCPIRLPRCLKSKRPKAISGNELRCGALNSKRVICSSVCCSLWIADFLVCTLLSLSPPPDTRKCPIRLPRCLKSKRPKAISGNELRCGALNSKRVICSSVCCLKSKAPESYI